MDIHINVSERRCFTNAHTSVHCYYQASWVTVAGAVFCGSPWVLLETMILIARFYLYFVLSVFFTLVFLYHVANPDSLT